MNKQKFKLLSLQSLPLLVNKLNQDLPELNKITKKKFSFIFHKTSNSTYIQKKNHFQSKQTFQSVISKNLFHGLKKRHLNSSQYFLFQKYVIFLSVYQFKLKKLQNLLTGKFKLFDSLGLNYDKNYLKFIYSTMIFSIICQIAILAPKKRRCMKSFFIHLVQAFFQNHRFFGKRNFKKKNSLRFCLVLHNQKHPTPKKQKIKKTLLGGYGYSYLIVLNKNLYNLSQSSKLNVPFIKQLFSNKKEIFKIFNSKIKKQILKKNKINNFNLNKIPDQKQLVIVLTTFLIIPKSLKNKYQSKLLGKLKSPSLNQNSKIQFKNKPTNNFFPFSYSSFKNFESKLDLIEHLK